MIIEMTVQAMSINPPAFPLLKKSLKISDSLNWGFIFIRYKAKPKLNILTWEKIPSYSQGIKQLKKLANLIFIIKNYRIRTSAHLHICTSAY